MAAAYTQDARHAQALLDARADMTIRDLDGMTALDWTAVSGNVPVARKLIDAGVPLGNVDNQGDVVVTHAIRANRHNILRLLLSNDQLSYSIEALPIRPKARIIETIAKHANVQTMQMMAAWPCRWLVQDLGAVGGKEALFALVEARGEAGPEMFRAFAGILNEHGEGPAVGGGVEEDEKDEEWVDGLEFQSGRCDSVVSE